MYFYRKRQSFKGISKRVGKVLSGLGLTPNMLSILGLVFSILLALSIASERFVLASLLLLLVAFFDFSDGAVARFLRRKTKKGAYLDTIVDRYVDFIIISSLFFTGIPGFLIERGVIVLLLLFGTLMTTYAKAAAGEKGIVTKNFSSGFLSRPERMLAFLIIFMVASFNKSHAGVLLFFFALLTNLSALERIIYVLKYKGWPTTG